MVVKKHMEKAAGCVTPSVDHYSMFGSKFLFQVVKNKSKMVVNHAPEEAHD